MPQHADLIVTNARVLNVDADNPRAEALALKDGRIAMVGDGKSVGELKGPGTKVIDAEGNTVVPGFIEAHMHLFAGAAELDHLQLFGVSGFDALAKAVRDYAPTRPSAKVLLAQGADYTILSKDERVTRHHLDRIISDRPFAMTAPDHHTMWANARALEIAGLLNGKTLGPGNEVVMAADGLAEGELREGPGDAYPDLVRFAEVGECVRIPGSCAAGLASRPRG
jgi:predicted amidohydrolase YtcJ